MLLSAVRMISRKNGGEGSHFMLCWCVFVLQALVINKQAVKEQTTSFIQEENCFVFVLLLTYVMPLTPERGEK